MRGFLEWRDAFLEAWLHYMMTRQANFRKAGDPFVMAGQGIASTSEIVSAVQRSAISVCPLAMFIAMLAIPGIGHAKSYSPRPQPQP